MKSKTHKFAAVLNFAEGSSISPEHGGPRIARLSTESKAARVPKKAEVQLAKTNIKCAYQVYQRFLGHKVSGIAWPHCSRV